MEPKITIEQFRKLLSSICDRETSSDPECWTPENPLWGHCAVITLIAQNIFGGEPMRAPITHIPKFAHMRTHYWNWLSIGKEYDFTAQQFGNEYPRGLVAEQSSRKYILYDPKTGEPREIMNRYKLLAYRLAKALNGNNSLFKYNDFVYKQCFYKALESPCQKMKFGCVLKYFRYNEITNSLYNWGYIATCNEMIEPLKSLCDPNCIRLNIPSRTESMIGACSHAEEYALWAAARQSIPLDDYNSEMYVAGIYPNGLPYIKEKNEFTCLRCAVSIYLSGIRKVFVPTINGWQSLSGDECVKIALAYATGEKKV